MSFIYLFFGSHSRYALVVPCPASARLWPAGGSLCPPQPGQPSCFAIQASYHCYRG